MKKIVSVCLVITLCFSLVACSGRLVENSQNHGTTNKEEEATLSADKALKKASKIVKKMTLEEKIGQLFIVDLDKLNSTEKPLTELTEEIRELIEKYKLAGVVLDSENIKDLEQIKKLNQDLVSCNDIPMYIGTTEEGGGDASIAKDCDEITTTGFVTPQEMGQNMTKSQVRDAGTVLAKELAALGFNLNFAPTADVYENGVASDVETAIISAENALGEEAPNLADFLKKNKKGKISKKARKKAQKQYSKALQAYQKKIEYFMKECTEEQYSQHCFGNEEDKVSDAVSAMVEGIHEEGVGTVLKTFPGIASVAQYHKLVPTQIDTGLSRLRRVHFKPYSEGIKAETDMIMVGHVALAKLDGTTPASMSRVIMSDLLRDEMEFEGVVITEQMDLPVITNEYTTEQAVLRAVVSGADLVYNPEDLEEAIFSIKRAVMFREIDEKVINQAVLHVIQNKLMRGIYKIKGN